MTLLELESILIALLLLLLLAIGVGLILGIESTVVMKHGPTKNEMDCF